MLSPNYRLDLFNSVFTHCYKLFQFNFFEFSQSFSKLIVDGIALNVFIFDPVFSCCFLFFVITCKVYR